LEAFPKGFDSTLAKRVFPGLAVYGLTIAITAAPFLPHPPLIRQPVNLAS
jgi:hypothetical protein